MTEQPSAQKRTIREINALVRALVEQETLGYPYWIGGFVSRYYLSDFGHIYFDLNHDDHIISCMIREQVRGTLEQPIANGMDVEVFGSIRVYEKSVKVQIEVEKIRVIGDGKLPVDANLLQELGKKGFWPRTKKTLPLEISKIGLVTSEQSEARPDFENTYRNEDGKASIKLFDVRLQGQQAAREIAEKIRRISANKECDVIVLVRGGGRTADLATFNDLAIAEAICQSNIPVLTGIGHQRDETLADIVADVSTITPTAAANYLAKLKLPQVASQTQPSSSRFAWNLVILAAGLLLLSLLLFILTR